MDVITHNRFTFTTPGDRDTSFGMQGVISLFELQHDLNTDRHIKDIKVLSTDKILAALWLARDLKGLYGLARFNPDGSVDTSFADNGLVCGNFAEGYDCAGGKLAVLADGKILMLGWSRQTDVYSPRRLVITRFNQDGVVDHDFGEHGCVIIENSELGELASDASTLQVLDDGKILVSATYQQGDSTCAVLLRLNTRGTLDETFNRTGQVKVEHPLFSSTSANALLVQVYDSILVAGSARRSASEVNAYIARYSSTGELDIAFGDAETPGFSILAIADGTVNFHELIDMGAGKVVGVGQASIGQRNWGLLVGAGANGDPFAEFNGGRPVLTSFDAEHGNEWVCAHRQADGKIVTAGGNYRTYIARYLADGSIDRSFGHYGCTHEDTPLVESPAVLETQANGRILLAGNTLGLGGALGHIYGYQC